MKKRIIVSIIILCFAINLHSQVDNVPTFHPVYDFLLRAESMGLLPNYSLAVQPWTRAEITSALILISENRQRLSANEIKTLNRYEREFGLTDYSNSVVFYSLSDKQQLFSKRIFSDDEKYIFRLKDSVKTVSISPLAMFDFANSSLTESNYLIGNLGISFYGSLSDRFGFYLQATNGSLISGDRSFASQDDKYAQNIKFVLLNDDIDFSESNVRFEYDWFYASIGRESRLDGAGLRQRVFISDIAPPIDALNIGAKFKNFEYNYTHAGLLALPGDDEYWRAGFTLTLMPKYLTMHKFRVKPSWGEISFWEGIVYSNRYWDAAYLNPLSFLKSMEHALRDRDNALMGMDATVRFLNMFQLKGSFILDDIIFERIGTGWWGNKHASNIALIAALPKGIDVGFEYARVQPYTFSHFNIQNSYTNDSLMIGSYLPPNSEQWSLMTQYWWGSRYPIKVNLNYFRWGRNIYDDEGELIKNVGGDVLQTRRHPDFETGRPADSEYITFLEGDLFESLDLELIGGFELMRGMNLRFAYKLRNMTSSEREHYFRSVLSIGDFWRFR